MRATRVLFISLVVACSSASSEPPGDEAVSEEQIKVDQYIASLPYLPVAPALVMEGPTSEDRREGDYSCTTQNLAETRQYDRVVAYAANSDSMFPGAIIGADSVVSGLFTQVVLPRAPATISVSLENLGGKKHAVIANPMLSSYRDAVSSILEAEVTGSTAANLYSEIEEVHSEKQLSMALGVQASWALGVASLKSSFDFSKQNVMSRYLVRYTQAYYTVDLDAPASPSALFAKDIKLADVQAKLDANRPPVYVSSVTYGRMVLFTFESKYSSEEMSAALEFAYSAGTDVSGDVSVTYKDIISQSTITAFILGGDAGAAVKTIDSYEALKDFIKSGGNYSRESPGAPIAYKLSYLKDNAPARMSFTTDYQLKDCVRVSQKIRVTLNSIAVDVADDYGDELEVYGLITATGTNTVTLFNKSAANYVPIHQGAVFGGSPAIDEKVIDVVPSAGQTIKLHADLKDDESPFGPRGIGNEISLNPFETGWRKQVTLRLTGDGAVLRVTFSLSPI